MIRPLPLAVLTLLAVLFAGAVTPPAKGGVFPVASHYPLRPNQTGYAVSAWYRYGTGITSAGSPILISAWADQSGNARNLAQGTGSAQPILDTVRAGEPSVRFDGSLDQLRATFTSNQPYFYAWRGRILTHQTGRYLFDGGTGAANTSASAMQAAGNGTFNVYAGSSAGNLQLPVTKWGSVSFMFNGASSAGEIYGGASITGNAFTGNAGGITLGGDGVGTGAGNTEVREFAILAGAVPVQTRTRVLAYMHGVGSAPPIVIACDGDSLTLGFNVALADAYPAQLRAAIGGRHEVLNFGVGSQTITNMASDAATQIDVYNGIAGRTFIVPAFGGTNDLYFGATGAATYAAYVSYMQARQAAGAVTIAFTLLPRSDGGTPGGFNAERLAFNASVRANWATFASGLVDLAEDPRIGDAGDEADTTYYLADLVHLNAAGYAIVRGALQGVLTGLGYVVPQ